MDLEDLKDFKWPHPWTPIEDEQACLDFPRKFMFGGKEIAPTIVEELKREIGSEKHPLFNVECRAVAYNRIYPEEFILLSSKPSFRVTMVHLTWSVQEDPEYPSVVGYESLEEWADEVARFNKIAVARSNKIVKENKQTSSRRTFRRKIRVRKNQDLPASLKEQITSLVDELNDRSEQKQQQAAKKLGELGDHGIAPLVEALKDPNEYIRAKAAWALGEIGNKQTFDPLVETIQETPDNSAAIAALKSVDPERAVGVLMQLLNDDDWQMRWFVARELYFLRDARAVDVLIDRVKNDPVDNVRLTAARALGALYEKGIDLPLFENVDDPSEENRVRVALKRMRELGVQSWASTDESFTLLVPHNLPSSSYIEVGYLMAQLTNEPFPKGYSPLADVPSLVVPNRQNACAEVGESHPHGMKYRVKRSVDPD